MEISFFIVHYTNFKSIIKSNKEKDQNFKVINQKVLILIEVTNMADGKHVQEY